MLLYNLIEEMERCQLRPSPLIYGLCKSALMDDSLNVFCKLKKLGYKSDLIVYDI